MHAHACSMPPLLRLYTMPYTARLRRQELSAALRSSPESRITLPNRSCICSQVSFRGRPGRAPCGQRRRGCGILMRDWCEVMSGQTSCSMSAETRSSMLIRLAALTTPSTQVNHTHVHMYFWMDKQYGMLSSMTCYPHMRASITCYASSLYRTLCKVVCAVCGARRARRGRLPHPEGVLSRGTVAALVSNTVILSPELAVRAPGPRPRALAPRVS